MYCAAMNKSTVEVTLVGANIINYCYGYNVTVLATVLPNT